MWENRRTLVVGVVTIGALVVVGMVWSGLGSGHADMGESVRPEDGSEPRATTRSAAARARRTEAGAVATAAYYATVFDSEAFVDPGRRADLIERFAADHARDELAASFGDVAELVRDRLGLTEDVVSAPGFVWRWVPAGWEIREYAEGEALIAIWGVGIFAAQGRQLDQPGWQTVEVGLRWERDAWRLASVGSEPGPNPPPAGSVEAAAIGREIARFGSFEHHPALREPR